MKPAELTRLDRKICGTVWTSAHPQALMNTLCYDIGPRPTATKAMRQGQEFLAGVLRKIGADNIHTQTVPAFAWTEGPSSVQLLAPRRQTVESVHHVHSKAGQVTGSLVYAGTGAEEQLDRLGRKLDGSVVLIGGHEIAGTKFVPLPDTFAKIVDRGAAAIITITTEPPGCPAIDVAACKADLPVPALGVSQEEGRSLIEAAQDGKARIRVEAAGKSRRSKCLNLVADLGPARKTDEHVVLSAHLDTFYLNPGAFDNLTGVVPLIEIARALAPMRSRFRRTLRLIVFTGEEYMFQGSRAYVQQSAGTLDDLSFVLNLDSLFPATARGVAVMWSPAMRDYIDKAFGQTQCEVRARDLFCMSSDYLPFMLEGIAAARPAHFGQTEKFPPWSHTRLDTADKIPTDWLRRNAMTYALLLLRVLTDPKPLPTKRRSRRETADLIAREEAAENLRALGCDV